MTGAIVKTHQAEIRQTLEAHVDREYLAKIRELVPSASPILGVRVPAIRLLVKPFHDRNSGLTLAEACGLVGRQFAGRCREEMLFGVFLLVRFKKALTTDLWPEIDSWLIPSTTGRFAINWR